MGRALSAKWSKRKSGSSSDSARPGFAESRSIFTIPYTAYRTQVRTAASLIIPGTARMAARFIGCVAMLMIVFVTMPGIGSVSINQRAAGVGRMMEFFFQPVHHAVEPHSIAQIRENKWAIGAHAARVAVHHFERRADIGC